MHVSRPLLALLTVWLAAAAADPIVAERGADTLTASQVRALIANADADTRKRLQTDPKALNSLITDAFLQRTILAAAQSAHWADRPDVAALLRRTRDAAIVQTFLAAQAPVPAGYPSDADIEAAYEKAKPQLMQPRAYHIAQAFIANTSADSSRKLTALQADVTAGRADWASAAKRAGAQTADLGWVAENRLQPAAREAVAGLLEGQLSPPVCAAGGCTVLKLLATRPAGPAPLADARETLVRALRQARQRAAEQAYANTLLGKQPVRLNEIELSHLAAP